ncbi:MAG: hypothetical protein E7K04_05800, partial [Helicobacter sp.]|nr:hypothetical protein [Helicobacter sp.]
NTTQHNTTQHNTTQHNTTQHNTTQHNTTQHNTTARIVQPYFRVLIVSSRSDLSDKANNEIEIGVCESGDKDMQSSYNEYEIIGQSGVIEPEGICSEYKGGRPYINGDRKYARLFVKRKK